MIQALLAPFVDPESRTAWFALASFVGVAAIVGRWNSGRWSVEAVFPRAVWRHPSAWLDVQLVFGRQLLWWLGFGLTVGLTERLAVGLVRGLDALVGRPDVPVAPVVLLYPVVLFLAWDLSRYLLHRVMHQVPALWALHEVHHSAEVLTPLTFHRVHPLEGLLYGLRGVCVTGLVTGVAFWLARGAASDWTLFGVNGVGLLLNTVSGNLRHSHVWIRYPAWLEGWLISPAQHQLHHVMGNDHVNYGTWLAVWDRLGGSLQRSPAACPGPFGVASPRHGHDLLSAWVSPVAAWIGRRGALTVASLLIAGRARAQDDADLEIVVQSDDRTPRVAGSAHVLEEEDLELFEMDDIHSVLAVVPGVYSRGEDGFGLRPNIGIRGANSDRSAKLTLLEDGVPASPAPYAAPAAYYFPMVTRMVGVEVFKGPAAIQTGPQTVGGAINLISRSVPRDGTRSVVDLGAGLRNTGKVHAWVGHGDERVGALGEVALLTTTGFKQLDDGGPTGFVRGEGMLKLRAGTDPSATVPQAVEIKVGYAGEDSHETYLGLSVDDLDTPYRRYAASQLDRMIWQRSQLEVSWPVDLGDVQIRTTAYHHDLRRVWTKVNRLSDGSDLHDLLITPDLGGQAAVGLSILRGEENSGNPDQRVLLGTNDRRLVNHGVQSTLRWHASAGALESRLQAGLRFHADRVDRAHTERAHDMLDGRMVDAGQPTAVLLDALTGADALAAYVHEDLRWGVFSVLPGIRVEAVQTWRHDEGQARQPTITRVTPLPGLGALLEARRGVQLFGGVYRGFSPVAPGEAEDVDPESSWNVEAGTRLGSGTGTHAELVWFQNEYANLVGQCTVSGGCLGADVDAQFNGGGVRMIGLESVVGARWLLPRRLSLPVDLTGTFTRGVFLSSFDSAFPQFGEVDAGDALPYVPRLQGAAVVGLEHPRFRLATELTGRSGMLDAAAPLDQEPEVPPLVLLGAAGHLRLASRWEAYATGSNLTGRTTVVSWRPFGARPVAPLQVMVGLKWTARPDEG